MSKKRTHDEFIKEFKEKNNKDIVILGTYITSKTPIKVKCQKCGREWYMKPERILINRGCQKCAGTYKKTHEEFKQELKIKNPTITILGKYINSQTKIKTKCNKCGYEWETLPTHLLQKHGCPKCAGKASYNKPGYTNRLKRIYDCMVYRCSQKRKIVDNNYGGRGISVCEEWLNDRWKFYDWAISHGYKDNLSIDRIDVNKNYSPENCRWATNEEQSLNKRGTYKVIYNNEEKPLLLLLKELYPDLTKKDIYKKYNTIKSRINKGWDIKKALFK